MPPVRNRPERVVRARPCPRTLPAGVACRQVLLTAVLALGVAAAAARAEVRSPEVERTADGAAVEVPGTHPIPSGAGATADSAPVPLVRTLLEQGTSVAEHAISLTDSEDITAEEFWRREPLGFDRHALTQLADLLVHLPRHAPGILRGLRSHAGPLGLFVSLTLIALIATVVLRRKVSIRIARELGQTLLPLRTQMPSPVSRLMVALVRFTTTVLAPVAILGIYHLVRSLTRVDAPWIKALGDFLLAWATLAAALGVLHELLLGGLLPISKQHGKRLYIDLRRPALIGFLGLFGLALAERAGAALSVLNLGRFGIELAVLLAAAFALRRRDAILALFPPFENRAYRAFLRWLARFYAPTVTFTLIVLLAGLVGYQNLAVFLLVRSWMLVGIFVVTVGVHSSLLGILRRVTLSQRPPSDEAHEFYRATVLLVTYVLVIGIGTLFLHVLGLLSPISRLLSAELASVGEQTINLLLFVKAIAVVLIFVFLGRLICKYLDFQVYPALHADPGVSTAINTMVMWVLMILGTVISLNTVGLDLRVLTLMAGGLGIGIGFGLQSFANNMVSGMTLIFGRNLRRGDFVTVSGNQGFVQHVGIRVTRIRTRDAIEYTIPNSAFLENMIVNWSHTSPLVRIHVPVGVAYSSDPKQVRAVLLEVAAANDWVENAPVPDVWFVGFGESSLDFELLIWINVRRVAQEEVASQLLFAAFGALKTHGIEIPFPQRDLHIRSGLPPLPAVAVPPAATGATPPAPPAETPPAAPAPKAGGAPPADAV
jgi:small-conductance mechanosensitive channel